MEIKRYKVLFADDEYWTREKIRRIIPWEKYSLEFLEPAGDGEEVLRRISEEKPDILITDINMPYVNGVELLRRVQEEYEDIITFVISGYDDFSFVKDSFLAGSINYLVKPVGKIDLVNALSKALEIIGERQAKLEEEKKQQTALQKASSFIQDREFSQLLDMKTAPYTMNTALNNHMEFVGASLILIKIHNLQEFVQMYDHDMNLLSFSIKKRLREIAGEGNLLIFNHVYRSNEFLIAAELKEEQVERIAVRILKDFSTITDCPVTIIESEHRFSMDDLNEAYVQDISCMMLRRFGGGSVFLKAGKVKNAESGSIVSRISEAQMKEIQSCLKAHNLPGLKKLLFEEVGLARCAKEQWTYLEVRQSVQRFVNYLMEYYSKKMDAGAMLDAQSLLEMADKAAEQMDEEHLCEVVAEIMEFFLNAAQPETSDSIKNGILKAVAYVEEHFQENLSLSALAEQFHVESSYFSRMFRKETGENLMLFICRKRMQRAVEYMGDTDKNLTEIAFMVGYDDYTYFNKVFRKMMGKSPREYRNAIREEAGRLCGNETSSEEEKS